MTVHGGGQEKLAIRGEFDMSDGGIVWVIDNSLEALSGTRIPNATESVVAA